MTLDLDKLYTEQAINGKYRNLYAYLGELKDPEWRATFSEIETIIGFKLPHEAREYRPWWSDTGFDQVRACLAAGWRTVGVDMEAETAHFRRKDSPVFRRRTIDEILPPRSFGPWPENLSLRREDIYEERI